MSLTARPYQHKQLMTKSKSSVTLDTDRPHQHRKSLLFPRLPSASQIRLNPRTKQDLTPKTIEACRRCGINPIQILPPDYNKNTLLNPNSPQNKKLPASVLELRRTFAEKERLILLKEVDIVRKKIIHQRDIINDNDTDSMNKISKSSRSSKSRDKTLKLKPNHKKSNKISTVANSNKLPSFHHKSDSNLGQFTKSESQRNKKARAKTNKINYLISKKWENEARRIYKVQTLQKSNSLIDANRRHENHLKSIVDKTKQKNINTAKKSLLAHEIREKSLQDKKRQAMNKVELSQRKVLFVERMNAKQVKDYIKRQTRKFQQHQIQHRQIVKEKNAAKRQSIKQVRQKHKIALDNLRKQRKEFQAKKKEETRLREEKIRQKLEQKRLREEQHEQEVKNNLIKVENRMKEVQLEKEKFRQEMKKRASLKNDRVGKVQRQNETKRSEFAAKLAKKEEEAARRLRLYASQKEEERLLRRELSKLKKRQRLLQIEKQKKKDEYQRNMLEQKLKQRDEKLAKREAMRIKAIARQRKFNDKQRLLREELEWQFEHLNADEITSPVQISKFSSQLTGKSINPKAFSFDHAIDSKSDRDQQEEE